MGSPRCSAASISRKIPFSSAGVVSANTVPGSPGLKDNRGQIEMALWMVQGQMGRVLANYADCADPSDHRPDPGAAKRAFDAMMEMGKIDIATIEPACRG